MSVGSAGPLVPSAHPPAAFHAPDAACPLAPSLTRGARLPALPPCTARSGSRRLQWPAAPGPAVAPRPWGRQWIAIPATSSSGCSSNSAPWPCCSPKVGVRRRAGARAGSRAAALRALEAGRLGFVSGGRGFLPRQSPQVTTSCLFLEVAVVTSRPNRVGVSGPARGGAAGPSGQVVVTVLV